MLSLFTSQYLPLPTIVDPEQAAITTLQIQPTLAPPRMSTTLPHVVASALKMDKSG